MPFVCSSLRIKFDHEKENIHERDKKVNHLDGLNDCLHTDSCHFFGDSISQVFKPAV